MTEKTGVGEDRLYDLMYEMMRFQALLQELVELKRAGNLKGVVHLQGPLGQEGYCGVSRCPRIRTMPTLMRDHDSILKDFIQVQGAFDRKFSIVTSSKIPCGPVGPLGRAGKCAAKLEDSRDICGDIREILRSIRSLWDELREVNTKGLTLFRGEPGRRGLPGSPINCRCPTKVALPLPDSPPDLEHSSEDTLPLPIG